MTPVVETTENIDGISCQKFSLAAKAEGRELSLWVDPKRDHAPLRMVATDKGVVSRETTFAYADKPTNRIWFPIRITQQLHGKGNDTNTYVIEQAEFNRSIDERIFTYAGLNLPDHIPVMVDGITDVMRAPKLIGGKLIDSHLGTGLGSGDLPPATVAIPDVYPSRWWRRLPYLIGAFVLAALGIYFIRQFRRSAHSGG